jgi:hypothetical protein
MYLAIDSNITFHRRNISPFMGLGVRNATALLRATLANSVSLSLQNHKLQTQFCGLKMYCVEPILISGIAKQNILLERP